ncbi:hypothetical protein DIPPA_34764 [Diplonema papillatum]|nr:hypothetical protein DIPPA_09535 [Diplonema papillatum]KAJ9457794.1 hypothetical protein DIPPA_34764 [Diplonema papillatum]|eukprot:gene18185-28020_t
MPFVYETDFLSHVIVPLDQHKLVVSSNIRATPTLSIAATEARAEVARNFADATRRRSANYNYRQSQAAEAVHAALQFSGPAAEATLINVGARAEATARAASFAEDRASITRSHFETAYANPTLAPRQPYYFY